MSTSFVLNAESIINKFFISSIGPNTRKATIDPVEKVLLKEDAMNASASEHRDKTNASPIMTSDEEACP